MIFNLILNFQFVCDISHLDRSTQENGFNFPKGLQQVANIVKTKPHVKSLYFINVHCYDYEHYNIINF